MGDLVKRWIAGIGAAAAVIVIAVVAIGRMDRKAMPQSAPANAVTASKATSPFAPAASNQATAPQATPLSDVKPAKIRNETTGPMSAPQKAVEGIAKNARVDRSQPVESTSSSGTSAGTQSQATTTQASKQAIAQAQAAQTQPPVPPPDTAMPPAQQMAPGNTAPTTMQVNETSGAMKTTGGVNLNGTFTKSTALVYSKDQIVTPAQNGALVTAPGNAIALGTNAQFTAEPNSYLLDSGASNVNTSTGMVTKVKEYAIAPADPKLATHYEVNWEGNSVYVYARTGDVIITGPCRSWKLEQGKAAKIPNPLRCGALIWLNDVGHWPAYAFAGATGAGAGVVIYIATHQQHPSMSAVGP
jgi:hypothetical protein